MMPEMKFEVRNEDIEGRIKEIGNRLRDSMPADGAWGFSLLIFSFGEGGSMFYTSNARREDMVRAMQEFIAKYREN